MRVKGMGGAVRRGKQGVRWIPQRPRRNSRLKLDRNTREGEMQHMHRFLFSSPSMHPQSFLTLNCSAVQCSAVQYSTVQHSTVQCSAVQCSAIQYSTAQYSTVQYSTVQYSAVHISSSCVTIEHYAIAKSQHLPICHSPLFIAVTETSCLLSVHLLLYLHLYLHLHPHRHSHVCGYSSPSQLVESFCTDYDDILRVIDRPERMQNIMVGRGEPSGKYVATFLLPHSLSRSPSIYLSTYLSLLSHISLDLAFAFALVLILPYSHSSFDSLFWVVFSVIISSPLNSPHSFFLLIRWWETRRGRMDGRQTSREDRCR